jgi:hypothetical protein
MCLTRQIGYANCPSPFLLQMPLRCRPGVQRAVYPVVPIEIAKLPIFPESDLLRLWSPRHPPQSVRRRAPRGSMRHAQADPPPLPRTHRLLAYLFRRRSRWHDRAPANFDQAFEVTWQVFSARRSPADYHAFSSDICDVGAQRAAPVSRGQPMKYAPAAPSPITTIT